MGARLAVIIRVEEMALLVKIDSPRAVAVRVVAWHEQTARVRSGAELDAVAPAPAGALAPAVAPAVRVAAMAVPCL